MTLAVTTMQHLLLWRLAAGGGEDFVANLPAENKIRKALVQEGLIQEAKRVNPASKSKQKVLFLILTDSGWQWCQANMAWPMPWRSAKAGTVLQLLLPRLEQFLKHGESAHSFGDFIVKSNLRKDQVAASPCDVSQAIRDACQALGHGQPNVRIRLTDLRHCLPQFAPAEVTRGVWELSQSGHLSLYRLDDPREIRPEDREAAVVTSTGEEKHILYYGGLAS